MGTQKGYKFKLTCSKETRNKILIDCKKEFLKHHPELRGYNITQNYILMQIATYYIEK